MNQAQPIDDRGKWAALQAAPQRDALDPEITRIAAHLWAAAGGDARRFAHLAAALARDGIRYQTDTARVGGEHLGTPAAALSRGVDDCDAKARLFVALCLARGLPAVLAPLWKGTFLAHVYGKVLLDGVWHPVELTLARARLGDEPTRVPVEPETGKWLRT